MYDWKCTWLDYPYQNNHIKICNRKEGSWRVKLKNIMDMGNGYSLIKFIDVMDCKEVIKGQPWFVNGQIYSFQRWK